MSCEWKYQTTYTPIADAEVSPTTDDGWEVVSAGLVSHGGLCLQVVWRRPIDPPPPILPPLPGAPV